MAYFCLECFNRIEGKNFSYNDVCCDMDFCESCKKNKPCVVLIKPNDIDSSNVILNRED